MLGKASRDVFKKIYLSLHPSPPQAKAEADARIAEAEKKVKELSKQIHARKILLDENTDKLLRNTSQVIGALICNV